MKLRLPPALFFLSIVCTSHAVAADAAASTKSSPRPFATIALGTPRGIAVDQAGNLYVADVDSAKMYKIAPSGEVTAFGGTTIRSPIGLATGPDGAVFVADAEDNGVYRISSGGDVTPLAKQTDETGLSSPTNVAVDAAGNVFVANNVGGTILKITPAGAMSVFAGKTGASGSADGTGSDARFNTPMGIAFDGKGNLYVADKDNSNIRKITPAGVVSTLAGSAGQVGSADGTGTAARFAAPRALAADAAGNVFVADTENYCVRKITTEGVVSTLAGEAGQSDKTDGVGKAARFNEPRGIAVDTAGNVYVADSGNGLIRQITPDGTVTTIAGAAASPASAPVPAPIVAPSTQPK